MLVSNPSDAMIRPIESADDLAEARLEAIGYIFHGALPDAAGKRAPTRAGGNLLHFARCSRLDKVPALQTFLWFSTIRVAKVHLDEAIGDAKWNWCKVCQREITQRILNE